MTTYPTLVTVGFYPRNISINPSLLVTSSVTGYQNNNSLVNMSFSSTETVSLNSSFPMWGDQAVNVYSGTYTFSTNGGIASTILLAANSNINLTKTFTFPSSMEISYNTIENVDWSLTPISNGFTLTYSGGTETQYVPYILIYSTTFPASTISFSTSSGVNDNMYVQTLSYISGGSLPRPPVNFELNISYNALNLPVDITDYGTGGYITEVLLQNIITIPDPPGWVSIPSGFGSNLSQSLMPTGKIKTTTNSPAGIVVFIGCSIDSNKSYAGEISFYVDNQRIVFPLGLISPPSNSNWIINYLDSDYGIRNKISLSIASLPMTKVPAFQININSIPSFTVEINSSSVPTNIGVQGMQFSTTSPIPVCLINDCMVWTSQGLEKIQDLKSGCQLVAVDIEGNEFLAKFDVFRQTPRDDKVEICRHEEDVIVSNQHTIIYPDEEAQQNNFKCFHCEEAKPYKNQLGKESCHHCHIFNIKNHTPVVSWKSWLPIEKVEGTLYHVIPEDLINVKGFKVGKRRVLISEITISEIQLLMSGFIKV